MLVAFINSHKVRINKNHHYFLPLNSAQSTIQNGLKSESR